MDALKKSLDTIVKNPLILLPMLVAILVPGLMTMNAISMGIGDVWNMLQGFSQMGDMAGMAGSIPMEYYWQAVQQAMSGMMQQAGLIGLISFVLGFAAAVMTWVLASKDTISFEDYLPSLTENVIKYLLYFLVNIVVWVAFSIVSVILLLIVLNINVGVITIIMLLALFCAGVFLFTRLLFWFPIMFTEDKSVIEALKESFTATGDVFWSLLLVGLLLLVAQIIVGFVVGLFGGISFLYAILNSAIATIFSVVYIVFVVRTYLDSKGGAAAAAE